MVSTERAVAPSASEAEPEGWRRYHQDAGDQRKGRPKYPIAEQAGQRHAPLHGIVGRVCDRIESGGQARFRQPMAARFGAREKMNPSKQIALGREFCIALVGLAALLAVSGCASLGDSPTGERQKRIEASPNYQDGEFVNSIPTNVVKPGTFWENFWEFFFGDQIRQPPGEIPIVSWNADVVSGAPAIGMRAAWLGHASVMIEIEGIRILIDPVFSERASPVNWFGPERFHPTPIELQSLPSVDLVLISHNHFDHLDMETVKFLGGRGSRFVVALGIGAHLEHWDIPRNQIEELDWWEATDHGPLKIVCSPARHYSNRGLFDGNENFWASWTVLGAKNRFFYSGDTGFSPHFAEIGRRYGPFDLTLVKIGAYHENWTEIHMTPEEAIDAQVALNGRLMIPVHWGTFNMAYHDWDEPIRRAVTDAKVKGVAIATPRVGEWVVPGQPIQSVPWWESVK